jgi:F-type H+-transporting ATPase subunit delta
MKSGRRAAREARRLYQLCLVGGSVDEGRVRQVVRRGLDSGRAEGLTVLSRFERLVRLEGERRRARVESAVPLPPDLRTGIEARLARTYGPGLVTAFAENADLIGGVRVQVGSDVYDGSVLGGLAALEARF